VGRTRVPSRPSFSTALRKGFTNPSHLRKTLVPGISVLPRAISLEIDGQWPVCCAGASPTEDPRPRLFSRPLIPVSRWALPVSSEGIVGKWYSWALMRSVRRRWSWLIAVALFLQLGAMMAPSVLAAAGIDIEDVCTCPTGTPGATCPMHHGKTSQSQDSSNHCALKSAAAPSTLALLTLSSGVGIVPAAQALQVSVETSAISPVRTSSFASRTELPDSPPPRR
jgi:hypothetical protein